MTDAAMQSGTRRHDWTSPEARRRVRRRYGADRRLQIYGMAAIALAVGLLAILIGSLVRSGASAFITTRVELPVSLPAGKIDPSRPADGNYRVIVRDAFAALFPEIKGRSEQRDLGKILSSGAQYILRDHVVANPQLIGTDFTIRVPVSDPYDQLYKGVIPRGIDALGPDRLAWFASLQDRGLVADIDGNVLVRVAVDLSGEPIDPEDLPDSQVRQLVVSALRDLFPDVRGSAYREIFATGVVGRFRDAIEAQVHTGRERIEVMLPVSENYQTLHRTGAVTVINPRFPSQSVLDAFDSLVERGMIVSTFSTELFVNADSRFPELAGLSGAILGSFFALLVCFLISFPVGIAAAVYLEEFAPRNRWTDLIEVNINNLAAVPSVVFGLLGLAVFLNTFGLPRSAPLVGGMVLALMTLPTIIIATRAALKAVPPSIREAALGVGASRHQVLMHHVLPLAMPGILTGTIIGLAQALGETAPLLLIGMNAFIPSVENLGILEPATALPTQIFSWADSPERGFVARTSAAILVLLGFLIAMNAVAIFLRQRFQRTW